MAIHNIIYTVWYGGLVVLSGLLATEYLVFKAQVDQLHKVRNEYAECIAAFKKQAQTTVKQACYVHTRHTSEPRFVVVNREPAYLRQSALKFARKHRLEHAVKKLYANTHVSTHISSRVSSTRKARVKHSHATDTTIQKLACLAEYKKLCRQALFAWPLEASSFWLSSPYGPRKNTDGTWGFHRGIDLAALRGTLVKAARSGIVVKADYSASYGNNIVIEHDNNFKTRYAHLDKILVRPKQKVIQGTCIGRVGATGSVRKSKRGGDASHLHFEIYRNGEQVNPFYYLS